MHPSQSTYFPSRGIPSEPKVQIDDLDGLDIEVLVISLVVLDEPNAELLPPLISTLRSNTNLVLECQWL